MDKHNGLNGEGEKRKKPRELPADVNGAEEQEQSGSEEVALWETENEDEEDEFLVRDLLLSNSNDAAREPYLLDMAIPSFRKRRGAQIHLNYTVRNPYYFLLFQYASVTSIPYCNSYINIYNKYP